MSATLLTLRTHDGRAVNYPQPKSPSTFNSSKGAGVSWAAWTWNPVTGCLHNCRYCYAREIAVTGRFSAAYPAGFTPIFHPERLTAPANTRIPRAHRDDPAWSRVFVVSMGDLYGRWVPDHWIHDVHEAMCSNPQWQYITFCRDSPCCTTLCCSTPTRCGAAAASQTGCSPARQEARHELAGGASPGFRHSRGCGRDVVVWDVWCEDSFDGIWHLDGICGDIPTPYLVREHCLKCELVRVSPWCSECVLAYRHEQEQQFNNGEDRYLWCYACGQFSLDWQAVDASQEAGHPNQDRAN